MEIRSKQVAPSSEAREYADRLFSCVESRIFLALSLGHVFGGGQFLKQDMLLEVGTAIEYLLDT